MDTSTFIWGAIGSLVVAGLGFGATKNIRKNKIKDSQIQIGNENKVIHKSKNVSINQGSEQNAKKAKKNQE